MILKLHAFFALIYFMIGTNAVAEPEARAKVPDNELVEHRLTVDVDRSLNFNVPKTWKRDREAQNPMGGTPTIQFRPEVGESFSVQVSVLENKGEIKTRRSNCKVNPRRICAAVG